MHEFEIIQNFFKQGIKRPDVILGIGDDAALIESPINQELVITTDTLVSGVHFPHDTLAENIGYKALAVNLSDLAAMGAEPRWITLILSIPSADKKWLTAFTKGLFELANQFNVQLIGGDLTNGPLCITIQAIGVVPPGQALRRSGAKPGDFIYVTGSLGDAGLALSLINNLQNDENSPASNKLNRPMPRVEAGLELRQLAHAAIDISDGFAADLSHILEQSKVGAQIQIDKIPLSEEIKEKLAFEDAINFALTAGDDYELCFTIPPTKEEALQLAFQAINIPIIKVGIITSTLGLEFLNKDGTTYHVNTTGYQHF
jgi:thiamine-monophosphate kinase